MRDGPIRVPFDGGPFLRGLLIGVPLSLALWGLIFVIVLAVAS